MSYASVASHNIPFGEMPKPDQSLADGHFKGETEAHNDVDAKINVLPAGSDVKHPDVEVHHAPHPEPIHISPPSAPAPHVSEVAPKPLAAPAKDKVELPKSGEKYEKKEKEMEKKASETAEDAKKGVDKAAKKAGELAEDAKKGIDKVEKKSKDLAKKAKAELNEAESRLAPYWEKTKDVVLRPGTLGGLMGVVNVGLLGTIGYFAYTRKDQAWDQRIVAAAVAGPLALFSAEGYVAESYLSTADGKQEAKRAKREGSKLYLQAKQRVLQPEIAGGLVGAVNVGILGTIGYFSYKNWNRTWDRQTVSAVAVGLMALSGLEGWAGKVYADKH